MSSRRRLAPFLFAVAAAVACSGTDTVLVLNFSSDPNVTNVTRIDVNAVRSNGSPFSGPFTAQSPDGGPMTPFFERVTLTGWEGHIHVTAVGITADQSPGGSASSDVDVDKGNAVVAYLNLALPDAGTDSGEADGAAGRDGAAGGGEGSAADAGDAAELDAASDASSREAGEPRDASASADAPDAD
jgi:hypothetical protein